MHRGEVALGSNQADGSVNLPPHLAFPTPPCPQACIHPTQRLSQGFSFPLYCNVAVLFAPMWPFLEISKDMRQVAGVCLVLPGSYLTRIIRVLNYGE